MLVHPEKQKWLYRSLVPALLLFLLGFALVYYNGSRVDPELMKGGKEVGSAWFEADSNIVYRNMSRRISSQRRSNVHPLFSLLTHPPVAAMIHLGVPALTAVRVFMSFGAGLYLALLYWLLREIGLRRFDSTVFTLMAAFSTSFLFFTAVAERHLFGGISVMAPLLAVAIAERRTPSPAVFVALSAGSFSITVTNWMVGLLATFKTFSREKSLRISLAAFTLVGVLWLVHKLVYPSTLFFLDWTREYRWFLDLQAGGAGERLRAFFVHSLVTPAFSFMERSDPWRWNQVLTQFSAIGSSGWQGGIAAYAWLACLCSGLWLILRDHRHRTIYQVVLLALAGQLVLHLVYGDELIVYSLNWLPMLIVVAATVVRSRFRSAALVLATTVTLLSAFNNTQQLATASALVNESWATQPFLQSPRNSDFHEAASKMP